MKRNLAIIAAVATLALLDGTPSRGSEAAASSRSSAAEPARRQVELEARRIQEAAKASSAAAEDQFRAAAQQFDQMQQQFAQARAALQLAQASSSGGTVSAGVPPPPGYGATLGEAETEVFRQAQAYGDRLQAIVRRGPGGAARALVVRSSEGEADAQPNLEEDLAVMLHLLDKAVDDTTDESGHRRTAMGINVLFTSGSSPVRSLYLDGYGALFLLRFNYPLLDSPKVAEQPKEKPATDSSWEEARRELYGQPGDAKVAVNAGEEFDADKVAKLKDGLFEALKSATNIRGLKPDDSITLCVFGGGTVGGLRKIPTRTLRIMPTPSTGGKPPGAVTDARTGQMVIETSGGGDGAGSRGTILTIRVKKSDVDALAKGRMTPEEFRKKATMAIYRGGIDGGGNFGGGGFGGGFGGFGNSSGSSGGGFGAFGGR